MVDFFQEILSLAFMRNALLAGALVALVCGIMGSYVVVNRMVSLAGGIAHATYGGIGISAFFGFSYLAGTLGFTMISALAMGALTYRSREKADTLIGVLWAAGMALGILLVDLTPGYGGHLMNYLFGSILTVPAEVLWMMGGLGVAILAVVALFYPEFLAISHDPEFARIRGIRVLPLHLLLVVLVSWTIVMAVQAVGLILVIALLTIPAQIAGHHATSLARMMILASALALLLTFSGILLAYRFDLSVGPTIILGGAFVYLVDYLCIRIRARWASPA